MYAMFSKAGNDAVIDMVRRLAKVPRDVSPEDFFEIYLRELAQIGHFPEVNDTEVREMIAVDLFYLTGRNHWGVAPKNTDGKRRWLKRTLQARLPYQEDIYGTAE
jgi:hypothetical protein